MTERFRVGSVSGFSNVWGGKWSTVWYVHDSAYCYRIVGVYKNNGSDAEARARTFAALLEEGSREHVCRMCGTVFPGRLLPADGRGLVQRWDPTCSQKCRNKYAVQVRAQKAAA